MQKRSKVITLIAALTMGVVLITVLMLILVANGVINMATTKIVITSESISAPYNGKALKAPQWTLKQGTLREGHTLSVSVSGEQTNVGTSENYITAVVRDANGVDVTLDYEIEYVPGIITVTAQELTIIAATTEKYYDGTPLSDDSYKIEPIIGFTPTVSGAVLSLLW